jgi:Uncharacterized protein conserved in bacteria (DUF2188)
MTNITNFHVVPATDRWQIVRNGVLFAECQSRKFAIDFGRKVAAKHGAALVIHPMSMADSAACQLKTA